MMELRERGAVSYVMVARPDFAYEAGELVKAGAVVRPLKQHFIRDPNYPAVAPGRGTRRKIERARSHWTIEEGAAGAGLAEALCQCHRLLYERRHAFGMARMSDDHFAKLLSLPQVTCLVARDSGGVGSMTVAYRGRNETHLIHHCVKPRATTTYASYLLMAEAMERWGRSGPVYLGGTPDGAESQGVGIFKQRWANRTADAMLVGQILDHSVYHQLCADVGSSDYFPAYRGWKRPAP